MWEKRGECERGQGRKSVQNQVTQSRLMGKPLLLHAMLCIAMQRRRIVQCQSCRVKWGGCDTCRDGRGGRRTKSHLWWLLLMPCYGISSLLSSTFIPSLPYTVQSLKYQSPKNSSSIIYIFWFIIFNFCSFFFFTRNVKFILINLTSHIKKLIFD